MDNGDTRYVTDEQLKVYPFRIPESLLLNVSTQIVGRDGEIYRTLSFGQLTETIHDDTERIQIMEALYYGWARSEELSRKSPVQFTPVCQEIYHLQGPASGDDIYGYFDTSRNNTCEETARVMYNRFVKGSGNMCYWLINHGNTAVGFVSSQHETPNNFDTEIEVTIAIYQPWRRKRLGTQLNKLLIARLVEKGYHKSPGVFVRIREGNIASKKLFVKAGFTDKAKQIVIEEAKWYKLYLNSNL